jgi:hypothetical protein
MVSIYCPYCHRYTALNVAPANTTNRGTHEVLTIWDDGRGTKRWIGVCNACQQAVLVQDDGTTISIYPTPLPTPTDEAIPKEIAEDLDEAKKCFSVACYRACAGLARRSIQSACLDKGVKERDLVKQIDELTQAGIITKDIGEWATVVRWVGNDALHPGKDPVTKGDAEDCLQLAEQFLYVVYVTPSVAKARKAARGK